MVSYSPALIALFAISQAVQARPVTSAPSNDAVTNFLAELGVSPTEFSTAVSKLDATDVNKLSSSIYHSHDVAAQQQTDINSLSGVASGLLAVLGGISAGGLSKRQLGGLSAVTSLVTELLATVASLLGIDPSTITSALQGVTGALGGVTGAATGATGGLLKTRQVGGGLTQVQSLVGELLSAVSEVAGGTVGGLVGGLVSSLGSLLSLRDVTLNERDLNPLSLVTGLVSSLLGLVAGLLGVNVSDILPGDVLPSGVLPSGVIPSGVLPSGVIPSGVVPSGAIPTSLVPSALPTL